MKYSQVRSSSSSNPKPKDKPKKHPHAFRKIFRFAIITLAVISFISNIISMILVAHFFYKNRLTQEGIRVICHELDAIYDETRKIHIPDYSDELDTIKSSIDSIESDISSIESDVSSIELHQSTR